MERRRRKDYSYRARQLPFHLNPYQTVEFLVGIEPSLGPIDNIQVLSLAESVGILSSRPTKTATVIFKTLPVIFDNENLEWTLPARKERYDQNIVFDIHFLDFTALNDVINDQNSIDCIAISGLASHPFGSWKQRGESHFMWLRDRLPLDLPRLRSILYGYDTDLLKSDSFQNIDDIAIALTARLKAMQRFALSPRSLVFLVHSLGGIILKRALVLLASGSEIDRTILSAIKTILFFGVPSQGMEISHLLPIVEGQPNESLIRNLSPDSSYLSNLKEQFGNITLLRNITLVSFYETKLSRTMQKSASGEWSKSGPLERLVDRESAASHGSNTSDAFPINKDHSNMVKFAEGDPCYQTVINYLCNSDGTQTCDPLSSSEQMSDSIEERSTLKRKRTSESALTHLEESESKKPQELIREMMNSIRIDDPDFRFREIRDSYRNTSSWVFDKEIIGFAKWLSQGDGIYWINGKPGSGKSTLMKYICKSQRMRNLLALNRRPGQKLFAAFFFHDRGTRIQKSWEGLLRGIIYQLLLESENLRPIVLPAYLRRSSKDREIWPLHDLEHALDLILKQKDYFVNICLFLDALDEYDGSPQVIAQFLQSIVDIPSSSATRVKICFSSRPWNVFVDNFSQCPGFSIHDHTREDIEKYISGRMAGKPLLESILAVPIDSTNVSNILDEILGRAQGVFLWVRLSVDELVEASIEGASPEELLKIVSSLPTEVEDMYKRTISRVPEKYRMETYVMLEIVLRYHSKSGRPLTLTKFAAAVACASSQTVDECQRQLPAKTRLTIENIKRRLKSRCGGLVEVVESEPKIYGAKDEHEVVQFMHQSVKEFAAQPGTHQYILPHLNSALHENGYTFLFKYTFTLIQNGPHKNRDKRQDLYLDCMRYARLAESTTGVPQCEILDCVDDKKLRRVKSRSRVWPRPIRINSSLSFAVAANLRLYVKQKLENKFVVNSNPGIPLLHCVVEAAAYDAKTSMFSPHREAKVESTSAGLCEMVKLLLDNGADLDTVYEKITAFQLLFSGRIDAQYIASSAADDIFEIARLFLVGGQDPNVDIPNEWENYRDQTVSHKPLHVATGLMVQLLIKYGADVNSRDSDGRTPLDICLKGGRIGTSTFGDYETYMYLVANGGGYTDDRDDVLEKFIKKVGRRRKIEDRYRNPPLLKRTIPVVVDK